MKLAVIAITKNGSALARRLRDGYPGGADLYLPERFSLPGDKKARPLTGNLADDVARLFRRYDGLAFVMATGIVVRLIAPLVKDKLEDPAVVVMDEKGRYVVSLLSGHAGGANELAAKIAGLIGAQAVITTASDMQGVPAVDTLAGRFDCAVEDRGQARKVTAAIVNGEGVSLYSYIGKKALAKRAGYMPDNIHICGSVGEAVRSGRPSAILITPRVLAGKSLSGLDAVAVLRPRVLVAGIGCNKGASEAEIEGLFADTLKEHGLSPLSVRNIATIEDKRGEAGLVSFAKRRRLRIEFIEKEKILGAATPSGPSEKVYRNMGVYGVCEPAALLSAGAKRLLAAKVKSKNATLAVAAAGS